MICPFCGGSSVAGPLPTQTPAVEMYCLNCRRNFEAFAWYGAQVASKPRDTAA